MKNDENSVNLSRRDFFKELGMIGGGGVLLSAFPWLQSCSADDKVQIAKEKVRIGFIGTGSRGQYHLNNLKTIPYADVVALCDNYPPHLKRLRLSIRKPRHMTITGSFWMIEIYKLS